jgi:acyl-CoA hydrolase
MPDLTPHVGPGAGVWWGQGAAEPVPLVHALLDQAEALGPLRAFCGITLDERLTGSLPAAVSLSSYGALGDLRALSEAGRLEVVTCHYSTLPRLFAEHLLPSDVGLVQVSPPDATGACSLGIGVEYAADALTHTPVLIAEVNQRMPVTLGGPRIPLERFATYIETDRPLAELPDRATDETDAAVAGHVAELIDDGATIQIGVGTLPAAVLEALSGHRDLGVHTGVVSDGVLHLAEHGVATGRYKEIDPGVIVTGMALGSAELYARLPELGAQFRPASYTHHPRTLASLGSLVSVNSAVEVDLAGQVGAEVRRGRYVGAVGGQADFSGAAARTGTRSIIALRSRSGGASAIKTALGAGRVTTSRADVDTVVTEYGIAHLRGCDAGRRARRLAAIAAPEFREELERAAAAPSRPPGTSP